MGIRRAKSSSERLRWIGLGRCSTCSGVKEHGPLLQCSRCRGSQRDRYARSIGREPASSYVERWKRGRETMRARGVEPHHYRTGMDDEVFMVLLDGPATSDSIAAGIGISKRAILRHLARLQKSGHVSKSFRDEFPRRAWFRWIGDPPE